VLAWDIQAVPNVSGYDAANGLESKSDDEIRDANGRQISQAQPLKSIHPVRQTILNLLAEEQQEERDCRQSNSIQFAW
jgi:hypothetical protein